MINVTTVKEDNCLMDTKSDDTASTVSSTSATAADKNKKSDNILNQNGDLTEQDVNSEQSAGEEDSTTGKESNNQTEIVNDKAGGKKSSDIAGEIEELSSDVEDYANNKNDDEILEIRSNSSSDLCIVDEVKDRPAIPKLRIKKGLLYKVIAQNSKDEGDKSKKANENDETDCKSSEEAEMPATKVVSNEAPSSKLLNNDEKDAEEDLTEEETTSDKEKRTSSKKPSNNEEVAGDDNASDKVKNNSQKNSESIDSALTAPVAAEIEMEVDEVEGDDEDGEQQTESVPVVTALNSSEKGNVNSDKEVLSNAEVEDQLSAVNSTQDGDNIETITGDQSLSEEAVLKNPDINVCLLPVNSSDKPGTSASNSGNDADVQGSENSTTTATSTSPANSNNKENQEKQKSNSTGKSVIIPKPVSELTDKSKFNSSSATVNSGSSATEDATKKTVKVYIPPKKTPVADLVTIAVTPTLRDCLQCAKFTTCSTKINISGIDCYLCSKECIAEHKLLHKKAVAEGSVVLSSVAGSNTGIHALVADTVPSSVDSVSNQPVLGGVSLKPTSSMVNTAAPASNALTRRCTACSKEITTGHESTLQWATMDFCCEDCLSNYQGAKGSNCQLCGKPVSSVSLGKYSVRFGYDTKQFCTSQCLEEFKKGLKACSYCQRDLNSDGDGESPGFLAPVGDKGQFKDFCSQDCLEKYDRMSNNLPEQVTAYECAVCSKTKVVRVEVLTAEKTVQLCSDVCFNAFKFVNDKMKISYCFMCKKYFDISAYTEQIMYYEDQPMTFCTKTCLNVQVLSKRKICPCNWCKVKKYNFDMIRKKMPGNQIVYMCSLNCLALYQVSLKATIVKQNRLKCDWCLKVEMANFHLTMSDASLRNFCSFECVDKFRSQYKVTGSGSGLMVTTAAMLIAASGTTTNTTVNTLVAPSSNNAIGVQNNVSASRGHNLEKICIRNSSTINQRNAVQNTGNNDLPVISSVHTLKKFENMSPRILPKPPAQTEFPTVVSTPVIQTPSAAIPLQGTSTVTPSSAVSNTQTQTVVEVLVRPKSPVMMKNKMTLVRVRRATKGTSCRPNKMSRYIQTSDQGENTDLTSSCENKTIIPIPVPIYIPTPMAMYSVPVPTLIPVPIPVPIPVFIPTTKNLAKDIFEDIKRIQETFPKNPIEAELVSMAGAAAKKTKQVDFDSNGIDGSSSRLSGYEDIDDETNVSRSSRFMEFEPLTVTEDSSSCGGDKTTSQLHSPSSNHAIDPLGSPAVNNDGNDIDKDGGSTRQNDSVADRGISKPRDSGRGIKCARKRLANTSPPGPASVKRKKAQESKNALNNNKPLPVSKPDEHMQLKYTLGVSAWKYFANHYNEDLKKQFADEDEKSSNLNKKLLRNDLLEMRYEELNEALTLLMKHGKMPNGESYSPDTKYYLALGIQFYLISNGRIDNIFANASYESFTDQLDKEARLFEETAATNGNTSVITRVIEEHLWEARQLGVHSPHVLLSTLMYLNTKYFNLTTAEEHMRLSFNQIIRHSKRGTTSSPSSATSSLINNDDDCNHDVDTHDDTLTSSSVRPTNRVEYLRYYPSQEILDNNPTKKKFYEQCENNEDPSRCPIRLYEFYLSRCPESVRSLDDVFYLQPERSCAPDSPVWYTSTPLPENLLKKMLNRMKMVKEINSVLISQ